jgi:hypothetical protein
VRPLLSFGIGADITDYFNYGFNEETWKSYCAKQVQLRLEQSMQGKIKVYQSDSKQDLPPELLAAMSGGNEPESNINTAPGKGNISYLSWRDCFSSDAKRSQKYVSCVSLDEFYSNQQ